jgi:hypothetical protein
MARAKDFVVSSNTRNGQHENLQAIKHKLEQNSLVELRLGFEEGEFRSKRDVQSLIQVIEEKFHHQLSLHKYSCLKSICIGWRLPNFALGPVLQSVIPALLQEPVRITHLQLILNDNPPIPEGCLRRILSWHSLESLDLRSITLSVLSTTSSRVQLTPPKQQPAARRNLLLKNQLRTHNSKSKKVDSEESNTWKQTNIINILPHISSSIKTLKLMACGINKHHIPKLCEYIRRRLYGLKKLSLRQNFTLDGGYRDLFSLRGIRSLDLSLCDLDENDGYCIGRAIEKYENEDLEQLSLAGNYRLSASVPDIIRAGAVKLSHMDCSFCGVNNKTQEEVFDILAEEPSQLTSSPPPLHNCKNCTIQSFRMQGIILNDVKGLIKCIRNNCSLRSLVIDHPREIRSISLEGIQKIVAALHSNYSLEVLKFDTIPKQCSGSLENLDFWLKLNRCGRRALLQTNEGVNSWSTILIQAAKSNDHNILFWMLKHGSVTFT